MPRLSASRRRRPRDAHREPVDRRDRARLEPRGRGSLWGGLGVAALLVLAVIALGRNPQFGGPAQNSDSPTDLLLALSQRYRAIESYEDRTLMSLQPHGGMSWAGDRADLLVRFVRPNKIRLQVSRGTSQMLLTCDGNQLYTQLLDESTRNFEEQIVQRPAPETLTLAALFSATEIAEIDQPDQLVSALMSLPCPLVVSQLALLLDEGFLPQLIDSANRIQQLPDADLAARTCARVQLGTNNGEFTFWIDKEQGLLRRIDYPPPVGSPATDEKSNQDKRQANAIALAEASVRADFDNVRVNSAFPPSNFRQQPGIDAKLVQYFIVPPEGVSVDVLGKRVSGFDFIDLDGEPYLRSRRSGAMSLFVWFNNRRPSHAAMQKLNTVARRLHHEGSLDVEFLAICTEPTTAMSHADISRLASEWQIPFPVVRDLEAHGRDIFGITQAPTIVIIDEHDVVQVFEVGGNSALDEELPLVFEQLSAGAPLAQQYLDFLAERRRAYERLLAVASVSAPPEVDAVAPATPRGASEPSLLTIRERWISPRLDQPGNLTIRGGARPTLLVNDGWHEIHEFSLEGTRLDTYSLGNDVVASDLRGFFGSAEMNLTIAERADRVSAFDDDWRFLFDYPLAGVRHEGISDALVEDLDEDGTPEIYLAFSGTAGVQRVSADGRRIWHVPEIEDALALCSSHDRTGKRFLLVTHQAGGVTPISVDGEQHQSFTTRPLHRLVSSPQFSEDATFCGVSRALDGRRVIVGLDKSLRESWTRQTPAGMFQRQTRMIAWAPWRGVADAVELGCWVMADQEGTVHVVSEDGSFQDTFSLGTPIHGIAGSRDGNRNLLFLSTHDAVRALEVR